MYTVASFIGMCFLIDMSCSRQNFSRLAVIWKRLHYNYKTDVTTKWLTSVFLLENWTLQLMWLRKKMNLAFYYKKLCFINFISVTIDLCNICSHGTPLSTENLCDNEFERYCALFLKCGCSDRSKFFPENDWSDLPIRCIFSSFIWASARALLLRFLLRRCSVRC